MATWEFSTILGEEITNAVSWTVITFFLGIGFPFVLKIIKKYFTIVSVINIILTLLTIAVTFQKYPNVLGIAEFFFMFLPTMVIMYAGEALGASVGALLKKLFKSLWG